MLTVRSLRQRVFLRLGRRGVLRPVENFASDEEAVEDRPGHDDASADVEEQLPAGSLK